MEKESSLIMAMKRRMQERGFPLVEVEPARGKVNIICYLPNKAGGKKAVAVIEVKNNISRTVTPNLLALTQGFGAEYAAVADGHTFLWYQRVSDLSGQESLIRVPDLPAIEWTGTLITDYPQNLIEAKLDWFRNKVLQMQNSFSPETAYEGLLLLIYAKIRAEGNRHARFQIKANVDWDSFIQNIQEVLPGERVPFLMRLASQDLRETLLCFMREIQPYRLGSQIWLLIHRLVSDMGAFVDKRQGFVCTPIHVANFIGHLLAVRVQPSVVVELGCGFGLLSAQLAIQWPYARIVASESDMWMAKQSELIIGLATPDNKSVNVSDALGPLSTLPDILGSLTRKGKIDLLICHPSVGRPLSAQQYSSFELAHGRSVRTEELFLERALELISHGGLVCIILPDSLLTGSNTRSVREFILREAWLEAVISLPQEIFTESPGLKASLVLLRKKGEKSMQWQVFMAEFPTAESLSDEGLVQSIISGFQKSIGGAPSAK